MSYLTKFPKIEYNGLTLTDISRKVIINDEIKNNAALWQSYTVKDGEYPEDIAFNFYGSGTHVDLILLMNNIIDPFFGWVLSSDVLEEFINDKYGADRSKVHHYEKDHLIVQGKTIGAKIVTNYDYEFYENEKKRHIRILKPEYMNMVDDEMDILLNKKLIGKQTWQN